MRTRAGRADFHHGLLVVRPQCTPTSKEWSGRPDRQAHVEFARPRADRELSAKLLRLSACSLPAVLIVRSSGRLHDRHRHQDPCAGRELRISRIASGAISTGEISLDGFVARSTHRRDSRPIGDAYAARTHRLATRCEKGVKRIRRSRQFVWHFVGVDRACPQRSQR